MTDLYDTIQAHVDLLNRLAYVRFEVDRDGDVDWSFQCHPPESRGYTAVHPGVDQREELEEQLASTLRRHLREAA